MTTAIINLERAIQKLQANASRFNKPQRYYRGDHDLSFSTQKFENAFGSLFRQFTSASAPTPPTLSATD